MENSRSCSNGRTITSITCSSKKMVVKIQSWWWFSYKITYKQLHVIHKSKLSHRRRCSCTIIPIYLTRISKILVLLLSFGSIDNWNTFQEQFLTEFGDDHSTNKLLNDLSNLKAKSREPIKDFNSSFNKLLNKIPVALRPSTEVQKWMVHFCSSLKYNYFCW